MGLEGASAWPAGAVAVVIFLTRWDHSRHNSLAALNRWPSFPGTPLDLLLVVKVCIRIAIFGRFEARGRSAAFGCDLRLPSPRG